MLVGADTDPCDSASPGPSTRERFPNPTEAFAGGDRQSTVRVPSDYPAAHRRAESILNSSTCENDDFT